ncbi:MAG: hypothetical protein GY863_03385 [bacterium]|nr:hypothetical protein [bacterium]
MRKGYKAFIILAVTAVLFTFGNPAFCQENCSSCHASMVDNPIKLPDSPPADLLLALSTPCFDYGKVLEEWYSVEELFVTTERHLTALEHDRFHIENFFEELVASREYLNEAVKQPLVSLTDFRQKTGKLRFDIGKVYREAKIRRIEQRDRDVFGYVILGTLFLLFLIVSGWRVASGSGEVNPVKTKLGYDELKQLEAQGKEAIK